MSLDTKVVTKHHHRNKKKAHTKPLFCCCLFFSIFLLQLFFIYFFRATSKLNSRTKANTSNEQLTALSLSLSEVWSTRIQAESVLRLGQQGLLGLKQKLYSDWSTRSNHTRIQVPSVLRLDRRGSK
jgi:hypothetical protein